MSSRQDTITHSTNRLGDEITVLLSGNSGGWLPTKKSQIDAYNAFINQDHVNLFKFTNSTGEYYMVRSRASDQSNRWVEIQDRTHKKSGDYTFYTQHLGLVIQNNKIMF